MKDRQKTVIERKTILNIDSIFNQAFPVASGKL
jgi:hypothetical protein